MPPLQVSSSNFCPARAAPVNCNCCYCEVETSRSNNSSWSGRPQKLTEWDRRVLKRVAWRNCLSSVATLTTEFQALLFQIFQHSLPSSKLPLETTTAQTLFVESFMKWVSKAEQLHTSIRSPCAMPSVSLSGVKLNAIGLWSSGNTFSGVMNHSSPSGSPTDESGFGGCQENATCPNA